MYPQLPARKLRLGDGDRPLDLRRLQRLRDRLPGREQHPRRRQGAGPAGPRHAVDPHRPLLPGRPRRPGDLPPARDLHALRERAVRGRLPGQRHGAQRRGAEPDGLQPLRRHAVLLEQLPVQGPPLQLLPLLGLHDRDPQDGQQPRGHGAQPRGHGEVLLLRAAHQPRALHGREGEPPDQGRRDRDRLRAGLPRAGDHLRQRRRPGEPRLAREGGEARLRPARRARHAAAHELPGVALEPEPDARARRAAAEPEKHEA